MTIDGEEYWTDQTAAVTMVKELALEAVEGGAITSDGVNDYYNVVIAYFSEPVEDLNPVDIEIRNVDTDQLFSVEKVDMSSDGMKATLTLTNSSSAGASVVGLVPNVDYNLIVTTEDDVASKVFSIPEIESNLTVYAVDPTKKTISCGVLSNAAGAFDTYNVPDDVVVDYAEILGETVTIKYDKTNTILSISQKSGEKVVYGAFAEFKNSTTDYGLQDLATEVKYYPNTGTGTAALSNSFQVPYETGANPTIKTGAGTYTDGTKYKYGKLVLNSNGTIKNFLHLTKWSGCMMVASTDGNYIVGVNGQEQTLKDYTILLDGESITVDDIEEDDIVFYNTTYKFAEVFNDSTTAELEAVYDDSGFKFDGKDRDGSSANYYDGTSLKAVTTDYLKALKAKGEDITVYYDRSKTPVFVFGETGEVASTSITLLLTAAGDGYTDKTNNVIQLKGFDGSSIVTKTINVSDIATVKLPDGSTWKSSLGKIDVGAAYTTAKTGETLTYAGTAATTTVTLNSDFKVGKMVVLTVNDSDKVTGFEIKKSYGGAVGDTFDGQTVANSAFKAGWKTGTIASAVAANAKANGAKLSDSTNVYTINKDSSVSVTKVAYSDFEGSVANANLAKLTFFYNSDMTAITDVVIDNQDKTALGDDADGAVTSEVVVKDIKYLDGKVSGLTIIDGGVEEEYSLFGSDASLKNTYAKGEIVKVTVLKDGETVSKITKDSGNGDSNDTIIKNATNASEVVDGVNTTGSGSLYLYADQATATDNYTSANQYTFVPLTIASDATLCKIDASGTVSSISLSDLASLVLTNKVALSATAKGGSEIDTIVVTTTARTTQSTLQAIMTSGQGVAAAGLTAIGTIADYDQAVKDKATCDIIIADYEAAGGKFLSGTDGAVAGNKTLYDNLGTQITNAGKKLIRSVPITTVTGADDITQAAALAKMNETTSLTVVLCNGSSATVHVTWTLNDATFPATTGSNTATYDATIATADQANYAFATDTGAYVAGESATATKASKVGTLTYTKT